MTVTLQKAGIDIETIECQWCHVNENSGMIIIRNLDPQYTDGETTYVARCLSPQMWKDLKRVSKNKTVIEME